MVAVDLKEGGALVALEEEAAEEEGIMEDQLKHHPRTGLISMARVEAEIVVLVQTHKNLLRPTEDAESGDSILETVHVILMIVEPVIVLMEGLVKEDFDVFLREEEGEEGDLLSAHGEGEEAVQER